MSTEEVYTNMNKAYANYEIVEILQVIYSEADRKLYIKVKWHTGEEAGASRHLRHGSWWASEISLFSAEESYGAVAKVVLEWLG